MSQEFLDHLKDHEIIAHRTPPYTPQHNGVSERRNKTLLDMVRSMMSQTTLPKSLWDYALETVARILNMVPTKKVEKTPYEVWHVKAPKLSYLKVWGCEALVKRYTLTKPDKLEHRSIKCIFVGYPKETMGYSFYYPPENKVLVARNAEFLENSHIDQEASGSLEDLEIIQEEDTHPSLDTSLNHEEEDLEIDEPQSDIVPIRRSTSTRHAPNRMCLYIDAEEHELRDLGEPANYKAALLDSESEKWLNAMNVEMQSIKDNELPPNGKTVGSKWLFKKKTDMDGNVHIYKARLVAKGYTQTPGIDYEETFSLVADIRAIRILIAIVAYYDYDSWKMNVKIVFLNGYLNEEEKLKLSKSRGASTPAKMKRMQNVLYASAVGSIMYAVRCTRPDVAFAQNITSRFQQNPNDIHWTTVKNILKYLRNTKDMFLVYGDWICMTTSSTNNSVFRGFFEKQKLTGPNFIDWYRQLRIVLSIEDKLNYLEQLIPPALVAHAGQQVAPEILAAHSAWVKRSKEIAGLMLMTMKPEIQRNLEPLHAHEMLKELKTLFAQQAEQELLQTTRNFHSCRQEEGQSVSSYVLKMKGFIDNLERLGHPVTLGLGVSLILMGLRKECDGFVQNYNIHSMGKTVNELHAMLKLHEQTLPKSNTPALNAIRAGKVQKGNKHKKSHSQMAAWGHNHGKGKNKQAYAPKAKIPPPPKRKNPAKDSICHECGEIGHWKSRFRLYLAELMKKKKNTASEAGGSGSKG
nr:zinc finger, CCHC-type [Tanacetum cinerariifolium]